MHIKYIYARLALKQPIKCMRFRFLMRLKVRRGLGKLSGVLAHTSRAPILSEPHRKFISNQPGYTESKTKFPTGDNEVVGILN